MKDEKGHGSDPRGAAHQEGVAAVPTAFELAKAESARLDAGAARAAEALKAYPRGPMGLTPDHVKASPEYRADKQEYDRAFQRQRAFNASYVKLFANELRAERLRRRGA